MNSGIGERLKMARNLAGMSQQQVAGRPALQDVHLKVRK